MWRQCTLYIILTAVFLLVLPNQQVYAIPAFARKYKFSCSTCHVAVPKLKEYGDQFAMNGFKIPEGQEPERYYLDTGDETLLLPRDLPVAVRFDAYAQVADRENGKVDFQSPFGIKLLSGGAITKSISYYFYFYLYEQGEIAGLEDAYLHFNDIAGSNLDIMFGQFQVCDPLFKRELRLTLEDYHIYKATPGLSETKLTYDRGIMFAYGFDFGLDLFGEIVNGNGIKPADENKIFDFDNDKNLVIRASQNLGIIRAGVFAETAKERVGDSLVTKNQILIYGPDFTIGTDTWELNTQYLYREDDNPNFLVAKGSKVKTQGGFVEFTFMPQADRSRFLYTLLYNRVESNDDLINYETTTLSISHMTARNVRLLGEFTYNLTTEKPVFSLGLVSAF